MVMSRPGYRAHDGTGKAAGSSEVSGGQLGCAESQSLVPAHFLALCTVLFQIAAALFMPQSTRAATIWTDKGPCSVGSYSLETTGNEFPDLVHPTCHGF